jgi:sphinganine-1-phosphate aldolase
MDAIFHPLTSIKVGLNNSLAGKEPWQIVTLTTTSVLLFVWLHDFVTQEESEKCDYTKMRFTVKFFVGVTQRAKKTVFRLAKLIPSIRRKIEAELQSVSETFEKETIEKTKHLKYTTVLPAGKLSEEDILSLVKENLKLGERNEL